MHKFTRFTVVTVMAEGAHLPDGGFEDMKSVKAWVADRVRWGKEGKSTQPLTFHVIGTLFGAEDRPQPITLVCFYGPTGEVDEGRPVDAAVDSIFRAWDASVVPGPL